MSTTIQQGDEFSLPFKIKMGDTYVSPSNADDVRIQLDDTLKTYSKSELTYDSTNQEWKYPVTEEWTRARKDIVNLQVGVKIDGEIFYSPTTLFNIGISIIKEEW